MKRWAALFLVLLPLSYVLWEQKNSNPVTKLRLKPEQIRSTQRPPESTPPNKITRNSPTSEATPVPAPTPPATQISPPVLAPVVQAAPAPSEGSASIAPLSAKGEKLVRFKMEDGVAVVQGDIVIGVPENPAVDSGVAISPTLKLWPSTEIPYFIPPQLAGREKIEEALEMFADTPIRFVPFAQQKDVLVFEESQGSCKSYVGFVGGAQPIWIAPNCGPAEIAHEILHALGFVHEQNRSDRDQFVEIFWDQIEKEHRLNFEILPDELMRVSLLSDFDFESMMMYPTSIFTLGGQPSMKSKIPSHEISPRKTLSPKDLDRLSKAYGFQN